MRPADPARAARAVRWALAAALGATLVANAGSARYSDPAGLAVTLSSRLPVRQPRTVLEFPPLGEVDARTHRLPVEVRIRLDRIEPVAIRGLADDPSGESVAAVQRRLVDFVRDAMARFAVRQALLGGAGSLAALYLAGVRRRRALALGSLAASAALALLGAGVALEFDTGAFAAARYRGVLQAAPQVVETARMGVEAVRGVGRRLQQSALQLAVIYRRLQQAVPVAPVGNERVVAHVSDLHNNPAAFDLLEAVVEHFGVDAVVDTGDMLDLGSDLEPILVDRIRRLGVPYLFAGGNHDTPRLLERLEALANVTVLQGRPVTVAGLTILGFPDPALARDGPEAAEAAELDELRRAIESAVERLGIRPDIVAVHNHRLAKSLAPGMASAVVFGHDHRPGVEIHHGTAYVDAGSTGAGGLRGLQQEGTPPFTLALLRFELAEQGPRLWAVDSVRLDPLTGELSLERRLVLPAAHQPGPAPGADADAGAADEGGAASQGERSPGVEPSSGPNAPGPAR